MKCLRKAQWLVIAGLALCACDGPPARPMVVLDEALPAVPTVRPAPAEAAQPSTVGLPQIHQKGTGMREDHAVHDGGSLPGLEQRMGVPTDGAVASAPDDGAVPGAPEDSASLSAPEDALPGDMHDASVPAVDSQPGQVAPGRNVRPDSDSAVVSAYAALSRGEVGRVDDLLASLDQGSADDTTGYTALYAGVMRIWKVAEGTDNLIDLVSVFDVAERALTYLEDAHALRPEDFRATAFLGMWRVMVANILGDSTLLRQGGDTLDLGIAQFAPYGHFLRAIALSGADAASEPFQTAVSTPLSLSYTAANDTGTCSRIARYAERTDGTGERRCTWSRFVFGTRCGRG